MEQHIKKLISKAFQKHAATNSKNNKKRKKNRVTTCAYLDVKPSMILRNLESKVQGIVENTIDRGSFLGVCQ